MYSVTTSETFRKQLSKLETKDKNRIRKGLQCLCEDPITPRSGADILLMERTDPPKYRIRIGNFRVVYRIEKKVVKIIEVFPRGRGYRIIIP